MHFNQLKQRIYNSITAETAQYKFLLIFSITYLFIGFLILHNNSAYLFTDTGREFYIPQLMLQHKVLYKDIVNIYGPLSYQINALLYTIFGISATTLGVFGLLIGLFINILLYIIGRKVLSFFTAIMTVVLFATGFGLHNQNWIYPYSYAILYSLFFYLLSIYFLLSYKQGNSQASYVSALFLGLSFACKYEFLPFIFVILFYANYKKKFSIGRNFLLILSFLFPMVASLELLCFQGMTLQDLLKAFSFMYQLSHSTFVANLYKTVCTSIPNKETIGKLMISFLGYAFVINFLISGYYFFKIVKFRSIKKYANRLLVHSVVWILIVLIESFAQYTPTIYSIFGWIPLFCAILVMGQITLSLKNNNFDKFFSTDRAVIYLAGAISVIKGLFFISTQVYGAFLLPLAILVFADFLENNAQKKMRLKNLMKDLFILDSNKIIPSLAISYSSILVFYICISILFTSHIPFKSNHSYFYMAASDTRLYQEITNYISNTTNKTDRLLVIPEGQIFNFMTERFDDGKLSALMMPPMVETIGESEIIKQIKEANIKYVLIVDKNMAEYSLSTKSTFPTFYGKEIYNYINNDYIMEKQFTGPFKAILYKKSS